MPPKKRRASAPPLAAAAAVPPTPGTAAEEQSSKKPRRTSLHRAAQPRQPLVDGGLSSHDEAAHQMAERAFWETYSTLVLWCWLKDFPDSTIGLSDIGNRERVISLLVTEGRARPKTGSEVAEFLMCWKKIERPLAGAPAPQVLFSPPAPSAAAASAGAQQRALAPPRSASQGDLPSDDEDPEFERMERQLAAAVSPRVSFSSPAVPAAAAAAAARASFPITARTPWSRKCKTCATPGEPDPEDGMFMCGPCQFRGDVPADHPANKHIVATRGLASPAAASSSSGQSSTDTAAGHRKGTALEQHFRDLIAKGGSMPHFASGVTATHKDALATVAKAYAANRWEPPMDLLVELIRQGKLRHVGFALPHGTEAKDHGDQIASFTVGADGSMRSEARSAKDPPALNSSLDFCNALVCVIIPALVDKPAAVAEWCALARTVLAIEKDKGSWPIARSYLAELLSERVRACQGFADISQLCISSVLFNAAQADVGRGGNVPPATNAPTSAQAGQKARSGACHAWNESRATGCAMSPCLFRHVCRSCFALDHKGPACPKGDRAPALSAISAGRGGKTVPRGSGSSVRSATGAAAAGTTGTSS